MEAIYSDKLATIKKNIGSHSIVDFYNLSRDYLINEKLLMQQLRDSLEFASFNILEENSLKFPGADSGVTGFFILSESHAAFHSYPEYGYLAIDIFSCGMADPKIAIDYFSKLIKGVDFKERSLDRGFNLRNKL
jgi:S-adenosylmethionine decarboxylase